MKTLFFAICFCCFAWTNGAKATETPVPQGKLATLLMEFESNIKWASVETAWQKRRDGWVKECNSANTVQKTAALLSELETNVKWAAVDAKKWEKRRDAWGAGCNNVATASALSALLLEFEAVMLSSGVETAWKTRRTSWAKECQNAKN